MPIIHTSLVLEVSISIVIYTSTCKEAWLSFDTRLKEKPNVTSQAHAGVVNLGRVPRCSWERNF